MGQSGSATVSNNPDGPRVLLRHRGGHLSRHELHQDAPYRQQTKGHSNNGGIGAHRAVSCLDRARMTKVVSSRCEAVHGPWSPLRVDRAMGEMPALWFRNADMVGHRMLECVFRAMAYNWLRVSLGISGGASGDEHGMLRIDQRLGLDRNEPGYFKRFLAQSRRAGSRCECTE